MTTVTPVAPVTEVFYNDYKRKLPGCENLDNDELFGHFSDSLTRILGNGGSRCSWRFAAPDCGPVLAVEQVARIILNDVTSAWIDRVNAVAEFLDTKGQEINDYLFLTLQAEARGSPVYTRSLLARALKKRRDEPPNVLLNPRHFIRGTNTAEDAVAPMCAWIARSAMANAHVNMSPEEITARFEYAVRQANKLVLLGASF